MKLHPNYNNLEIEWDQKLVYRTIEYTYKKVKKYSLLTRFPLGAFAIG